MNGVMYIGIYSILFITTKRRLKEEIYMKRMMAGLMALILLFCLLCLLQSTVAAHATEYVVDGDKLITEPFDSKLFDNMKYYISPGSSPTIKGIYQNIIEYYGELNSPVYKTYENTGYGSFDLLLDRGLIKEYRICTFRDGSRVGLLLKDKDLGEDWNKEIYETCVEYVQRYSKPYLIKRGKENFMIYDSDNIEEMVGRDPYIYYDVRVDYYKILMARWERERIRKEKYS